MREDVEDNYRRWWKGKYLKDGRRIEDVKFHSSPSGVYGVAEFILEDGSKEHVMQGSRQFKPTKKFVNEYQVFDKPPEVKQR
jgi:hypothetical protein